MIPTFKFPQTTEIVAAISRLVKRRSIETLNTQIIVVNRDLVPTTKLGKYRKGIRSYGCPQKAGQPRSTKPLGNVSSPMVSLNCIEYFFPSVCAPDQKKALCLGTLHCFSILASDDTGSGFDFAEGVALGAGLVEVLFGFAEKSFSCFFRVFDLRLFALLSIFFGLAFAQATSS